MTIDPLEDDDLRFNRRPAATKAGVTVLGTARQFQKFVNASTPGSPGKARVQRVRSLKTCSSSSCPAHGKHKHPARRDKSESGARSCGGDRRADAICFPTRREKREGCTRDPGYPRTGLGSPRKARAFEANSHSRLVGTKARGDQSTKMGLDTRLAGAKARGRLYSRSPKHHHPARRDNSESTNAHWDATVHRYPARRVKRELKDLVDVSRLAGAKARGERLQAPTPDLPGKQREEDTWRNHQFPTRRGKARAPRMRSHGEPR